MKKEKIKDLKFIYKTASKLFNALFYISIAVVALSVMIALIVLIVNVPTEEMLLPPYMKKLLDDGGNIVEYSIDLGNGATITKQASEVTLANIKNVIYCFLLMMGIIISMLIPIFRFLSLILKAISENEIFDSSNYRMVNYIAITTILSGFIVGTVERFVNFTLFKTFVANTDNVSFKFGFNIHVVLIGVVILILGIVVRSMIEDHNRLTSNATLMVASDK